MEDLATTEQYQFKRKDIKDPKFILRRLDKDGKRRYWRIDELNNPVFYFSVTTFLHSVLPTSPQLIKYVADKGYEASQIDMNNKAMYGTLLHTVCQNLLVEGTIDIQLLAKTIENYCIENDIDKKFIKEWNNQLVKDVMAFAQFIMDYQVKPLTIEMMLPSNQFGFAGAIDLVCEMTISEKGFFGEVYKSGEQKGNPKETKRDTIVNAIVDLKSGRKGFWESHELQLECYRLLMLEHYPEIKIDKLFNWSPKDWEKEPSYNLKDQTNSRNLAKLPHLLSVYKIQFEGRDRYIQKIIGNIDLTNNIMPKLEYIHESEYVKNL